VNPVADPLYCAGFAGVSAIDTSVGKAVQVSVALPLIVPAKAATALVPAPTQFTVCVVESVPKVATALFPLDHVADVVRFCEDPSLYVPVAVNEIADPTNCVGVAGVTAMDASVGAGTLCAGGPPVPFKFQAPAEVDCAPAAEATSNTRNREFISPYP
jgi:hypothetical protein